METDDIQLNSPTSTGTDRSEPAVTGSDRPSPTMTATRGDKHTLTTREVMKMFEAAGVPRNQRTIERYCKDGNLDCFPDALEKRYYITQASVDATIGQLKEIALRHQPLATSTTPQSGTTPDDTARPPTTTAQGDATVKQGTPDKHEEKPVGDDEHEQEMAALAERIKELEKENFKLTIDKSSRDQVIDTLREYMVEDRKAYTTEISEKARRVGELETQMLQLKAPDPDTWPTRRDRRAVDDDTAIEAEFHEAPTARDNEPPPVSANP